MTFEYQTNALYSNGLLTGHISFNNKTCVYYLNGPVYITHVTSILMVKAMVPSGFQMPGTGISLNPNTDGGSVFGCLLY